MQGKAHLACIPSLAHSASVKGEGGWSVCVLGGGGGGCGISHALYEALLFLFLL